MENCKIDLYFIAIILMILKVHDIIDWPWWAVFAPIWGPGLIISVIYLVYKNKKKGRLII